MYILLQRHNGLGESLCENSMARLASNKNHISTPEIVFSFPGNATLRVILIAFISVVLKSNKTVQNKQVPLQYVGLCQELQTY